MGWKGGETMNKLLKIVSCLLLAFMLATANVPVNNDANTLNPTVTATEGSVETEDLGPGWLG